MKWSITASLYKNYFLSFSQFLATIVTQQKFLLITNITWECFRDEKNSNEKLSIVKNIFQLVSVWNFLFQKDGSEHNMQNFVYCDSNLNISVQHFDVKQECFPPFNGFYADDDIALITNLKTPHISDLFPSYFNYISCLLSFIRCIWCLLCWTCSWRSFQEQKSHHELSSPERCRPENCTRINYRIAREISGWTRRCSSECSRSGCRVEAASPNYSARRRF